MTTDTAIDRLRGMCEAASTHIEARRNYIYAVDLEDAPGMWIAEFNQAVPRCYNNVELFMTARTAIPALLDLVAALNEALQAERGWWDTRDGSTVIAWKERQDAAKAGLEAARQRLEEVCPK